MCVLYPNSTTPVAYRLTLSPQVWVPSLANPLSVPSETDGSLL